MKGLYQHPNSPFWQYDFQHKGKRWHGSTGCTTRRAAEAYLLKLRHEVLTASPGKPPITVDEAAGLYQDKVEGKACWINTKRTLKHMVAGLGANRALSEITMADLQRLVAKRRNGRADISVNREIEDWRAVWRWAARNRFDIGEMPDWSALLLPVPESPPRELKPDEEARLFQHLRADLHPFALFAIKSGWRLSEVRNLCWSDLDLDAREARVRVKGGDVRARPLSAQMLAIITTQPRVCAQVFTYEAQASRTTHADRKGRQRVARRIGERYPLSQSGWRKAWAKGLAAAGIDALRFHDLRHTTATRVLRATGNLAATQKALSHKSLKTTLRYAHVLPDDVRKALDAADSRNSPGVPKRHARKAQSDQRD